jgi:hypothetical protein
MYYICKFSGTWSIFDSTNGKSRLLAEPDILVFKAMFPDSLRGNAILDAIMIAPVPAGKLQQLKSVQPAGVYYIVKFSGTWLLYEGLRKTERPLQQPEISLLTASFPGSLRPDVILDTLVINPIPASRLQQLKFDDPLSAGAYKAPAGTAIKGP